MNNSSEYKKYTVQARRGIKGEAFFESLVSDYCIPHHVIGPKDIGVDYICEWVYGDRPTGVLFAVQIKTFSEETVRLEFVAVEKGLNELDKYEIHNSHLVIDERTLHYWQGLGMPVYLFVIIQGCTDAGEEKLDCYYKRFTPILTKEAKWTEPDFYQGFYKVNKGSQFIAFKNPRRRILGFARDLFIDHVRWCYYKGSITYLDPRSIGLEQFRAEGIFVDLFKDYKEQICSAYGKTKQYLKNLGYPE